MTVTYETVRLPRVSQCIVIHWHRIRKTLHQKEVGSQSVLKINESNPQPLTSTIHCARGFLMDTAFHLYPDKIPTIYRRT